MQPNEAPHFWTLDLWEPTPANLETLLEASISAARRTKTSPETFPSAPPITPLRISQIPRQTITASETVASSTLAQLIGGCGVAAIDGYLVMRDYAAGKGLDLVELKHKGIDLQDLISTLIIDLQKRTEQEGRAAGAQRWKR